MIRDSPGRSTGDSTRQPKKGQRNFESLPEAKVTEGVSIDDYSTWRASSVYGRETKADERERTNPGVFRATEDRMLNVPRARREGCGTILG